MVLRAVGPRTREPTFQHAQLTHLVDVELLPSMRRAAVTLAADLKTKQTLDAMSDPVVVRLGDSGASDFVNELDETFVGNRAHEIVIHRLFSSRSDARHDRPRGHRQATSAASMKMHVLAIRIPTAWNAYRWNCGRTMRRAASSACPSRSVTSCCCSLSGSTAMSSSASCRMVSRDRTSRS
jgi:hypothetical protein